MFKLEKSKNGIDTIRYDNKYIHSKYDPIKEAKQFAEGNRDICQNKIIVLYGLGLGYHVEEICNLMSSNSMLYVFEGNIELIKYCKKVNSKVFQYNNVKIIGGNEELFYFEFSKVLKKVNNIIVHKPSLETIINNNKKLYNLINDFNIIKQQHEMEKDLIIQAEENLEENLKFSPNIINDFIIDYKESNKPYIIAASGPSLDFDIPYIKEKRHEFNIFAVGSALRTLTDNNIIPDCVVIIDPREVVQRQFMGIDCINIPLCFDGKSSRWAVNEHNGQKYIFNYGKEENSIRTGGTVAVAAMDLAIKCGARKIILVGQDLAFIGEKTHTGTFEKTYGFKDSYTDKIRSRYVKGIDGNTIRTTQGYITFKNRIESLIRENSDVEFINCSKGAYIEGTTSISFTSLF